MPKQQNGQRDEYGNPEIMERPELGGQAITAVKKNEDGDVQEFKLADGTTMSYSQAITEVSNGNSKGLLVQKGNAGKDTLRSSPDAHTENNLDNLPSFS